jgi:hypothetical protein
LGIKRILTQEEIDLIEKLFFDAYRLGEVSNTISISEPVLEMLIW